VSAVTGLDVARAVVDQLSTVGAFRKSLPLGGDPTDQDEIIATVTKVMAEMVDTLRDEVATLSGGAAAQLMQRHAERTRPVAVRPLATLEASESADTTGVQWRHGLVATIDSSDGCVVLRLPDKVMKFPISCADALAALHRGLTADPDTLPGLDHADATVLIRRLLREAVVVPVNG
jgi:hypothetical protein